MGDRDELQVPRQVYRLRVMGLALGFLCVGTVFYERKAPLAAWALLALHAFIWPHLAWYRARRSADPHRAERQHLLVDSGFGGVVVALMEFALLPSVLIIAMLSMDKIGWGRRFLLRASLIMATGFVATALVTRARFNLDTTMPMIAASLPLMVAYPIAVASVSNRSGRLARERRKAIEQSVAMREQLAHIARVGTLGEMAAGLAHELNQPLTAIHVEANTALELDTLKDGSGVRGCLTRISDQSLRAGEIVRRMRTFSRRVRSTREPADVGELIREVLALLEHDLRLANIETQLDLHPAPQVTVDRIEIQQVLVNLIRNAMEAMTQPAVSVRRLTFRAATANGGVRVSVSDSGPGIDPAIVDRLFHPFQSTKPDGLGLGLSICETLIEAHGGRIGAEPVTADGGATFFFELR
jgi:C4-dicarboxylate-specific signal transduction histidine kinase